MTESVSNNLDLASTLYVSKAAAMMQSAKNVNANDPKDFLRRTRPKIIEDDLVKRDAKQDMTDRSK
jgi:hypothetical protein